MSINIGRKTLDRGHANLDSLLQRIRESVAPLLPLPANDPVCSYLRVSEEQLRDEYTRLVERMKSSSHQYGCLIFPFFTDLRQTKKARETDICMANPGMVVKTVYSHT